MQVGFLDVRKAGEYEEFLSCQPSAMFFQSWRYLTLLTDLLGAEQRSLLAIGPDSRIRGILPLFARRGPLGLVYNSLPYYGSNGGILAETPEALVELVNHYNVVVSQPDVAAATLISNPLRDVDYAGLAHDVTDFRIGQLTPIAHSERHAEQLMGAFHYKTRNMIRKAEKLGVKVETGTDGLDFIAAIHHENMLEIGGRPKSPQFFERVPIYFRGESDYRVYMARIDGVPVAALLVFLFNRTAEYYTPVIKREFRDSQALSLIIFHAMCDVSQAGYSWWNWGGTWTSQEGVYRFKKRWGTMDKQYTYYTKLNNLALKSCARETLLEAYPHFYVLPFSALSTSAQAK